MGERENLSELEPLVSVIIPCHNYARYLRDALESVRGQTWRSTEIVVVDDGSTDHISDVIVNYPGVIVIRQPQRGPAAARNTGLGRSRGRFILFLDADDWLLSHALETGMRELAAQPDCAFVWGAYCLVDEDGRPTSAPRIPEIAAEPYFALLRGDYLIQTSTVLYRREILERVGGYNESLSLAPNEDYELYLRISRQFPVRCYRSVVAHHRRHGANLSGDTRLEMRTQSEVLSRQLPYLVRDRRGRAAYKAAKIWFKQHYYRLLLNEARCHLREWDRKSRVAALKEMSFVFCEAPWCCFKIAMDYFWRAIRRTFVAQQSR